MLDERKHRKGLFRQAQKTRSLHPNIAPNVEFVCACKCKFNKIMKQNLYLNHSQSCKMNEWNDELTHTARLI